MEGRLTCTILLSLSLVLLSTIPFSSVAIDPGGGSCGSNGCEPSKGENCQTCEADCGCPSGTTCIDGSCQQINPCDNDGRCEQGETVANCPGDCGDSDNDGVLNGQDQCANTPGGEPVNAQGCSCSQVSCGWQDCDPLDTECRDYHDVALGCTAGQCATSASCNSFSNRNENRDCTPCAASCICQSGICNVVGCTGDADCPADGWANTGETRTVLVGECGDQQQHAEEYRDHRCSGNSCTYAVTNTQWVDDGSPVANDAHCSGSCIEEPPGTFACETSCTPTCTSANCNDPDGCGGFCDGPCTTGVCIGDSTGRSCVECANANDCGGNACCNYVCCGVGETCDEGTCSAPCTNTFYLDNDGDGYGTIPTTACSRPIGYASEPGDCDDANPNRNPGLGEVCDGIDNDCDFKVDGADDEWPRKYPDRDLDGFGDSTSGTVDGCTGCQGNTCSAGFSSTGGDCDDYNKNAFPQATEHACFDQADNDCDGRADGDDSDCDTITCGVETCEPYSTTTREWRRDGTTCIEAYWTITTRYYGPYCLDGCAYSQTEVTEERGEETRPFGDGTTCTESVVGYCIAGTCVEACPEFNGQQPGCQATQPTNAVTREGFGCPVGMACYACAEGYYWSRTECKQAAHTIEVESIIATAGDTFILTPTTIDWRGNRVEDVLYRYSGFRATTTSSPFQLHTQTGEVGTHSLSITASRVSSSGEELLASKTIEIGLRCPANTACCPEGVLHRAPTGTSCTINDAPGSCDALGLCQPACDTAVILENSKEKCSDGLDNDCDGVLDCTRGPNGEIETSCQAHCSAYCDHGETACYGACTDLQTDRKHCGVCGVACGTNEQCDQGRCVARPDCFVSCDLDEDCGEQQACMLAGTCDAYCTDVPKISLNETERLDLLTSVVRQKTIEVRKTLTREALTLDIKNLLTVPLENVSLTITIPKELARTASELSSSQPFIVLHDDPVIRTTLPTLENDESITYYFEQPADPEYLEYIIIAVDHAPIDLTTINPLEESDLLITRDFAEDENGTIVTLTLTPGATLEDVRIPLEIPKCLATSISELGFEQDNYVVVNDDPLMVWTFDELQAQEQIKFTIPKTIDADCRDQLKAFGMAANKRTPINPWAVVVIIPIIGFMLVFFQQFKHRTGAERHLTKNEYHENGRRLGQTEDEIERGWHEYKRKF